MAYSYVWPPTLPQVPQRGFTETGGVLLIRTAQDAGPAKQRYKGQKPQGLQVTFLMSDSEVSILDTFVKSTIKGVARFGFTHPRLSTIVEVRIIPQGDGDLYTLSYQGPGYYLVQLQLEVLP